jgi:hypothetical protein
MVGEEGMPDRHAHEKLDCKGTGKGIGNVFRDPVSLSRGHSVDSIPNCRAICTPQFPS